MTYHRLLTHRSFALRPRWLEYPLTIIGTCASEGGPIGWVADHRRHHAHSDEETDTHTPNEGFFWAHMGWWMMVDAGYASTRRSITRSGRPTSTGTRSIAGSSATTSSSRSCCSSGLYAAGGMSWLVWGGFVRTVFVLHSTWLVNSATHVWGYRSHTTRDNSTNLWWVALLTYGEGWHNNHHAFQTSARHGLSWWEVDMTYIAIWVMKVVRDRLQHQAAQGPRHADVPAMRGRGGRARSELIADDRRGSGCAARAVPVLSSAGRTAKMGEP